MNKLSGSVFEEQAAFGRAIARQCGYPCALSSTATPTLTETGLLARLLKQQHLKALALARRGAYREHFRATLQRIFILPFSALGPRLHIHEWAATFVRNLTHYPPKAFTRA